MSLSDDNALALRVFPPSTLLEPYLDFLQFLAWSEDDITESLIEEKTLIDNFYKFSLDLADDKTSFKNKKSLFSSTAKEIIKKLYNIGFLGYSNGYVSDIDWNKIEDFYHLLKHVEKSEERKVKWALYYGSENKNLKSSENKLQRIETLLEGLNVSNYKKIVGKIMKSKMSSIKADLELLSDLKPMNKNIFRKYIDDLEWTSRRSPRELDSEILELLDEGSYSNQELSALLNTSKALISKSMNRLKINNEIVFSSHGTRGSNYYTTNCDNCPFGKDKDECRYDAEKSIKDSLKTKFNFEIPQNDLKSITTNQAVLQIRTILDDTQKHQTPKMEVNINQNLNSIFSSVMANYVKNQKSEAKGQAYVKLNDVLEKMPVLYILGFLHGSQSGANLMDVFLGQVLKDKIPKKEQLRIKKDIVKEFNKLKSILKN